MTYWMGLLGISLVFVAAERLWPRRKARKMLHRGILTDLLKYFLNSPELHEWHHVHPDAGPANRNFAINLALWDWIFGTAYLPRDLQSPRRLGFHGLETFPRSVLLQELWPLSAIASPKPAPASETGSRRT